MGLTHDFKGMRHDPNGHELLAVVATVHHQRVRHALDDRTLRFPEPLDGESAGRVGDVDGGADLDVVAGSKQKSAPLHANPFSCHRARPCAPNAVDGRDQGLGLQKVLQRPLTSTKCP